MRNLLGPPHRLRVCFQLLAAVNPTDASYDGFLPLFHSAPRMNSSSTATPALRYDGACREH